MLRCSTKKTHWNIVHNMEKSLPLHWNSNSNKNLLLKQRHFKDSAEIFSSLSCFLKQIKAGTVNIPQTKGLPLLWLAFDFKAKRTFIKISGPLPFTPASYITVLDLVSTREQGTKSNLVFLEYFGLTKSIPTWWLLGLTSISSSSKSYGFNLVVVSILCLWRIAF